MLGSTGGMGQMQGLREAQGTTNLQVRQSASDRVQDMIDRYRGRISEDVSNATVLGQQPLAYAELGVKTGGMLSEAAMLGSRYLSGAALTNANMTMGRYGGLARAANSFKGYKPQGTRSYSTSRQYGGAGQTPAAVRANL